MSKCRLLFEHTILISVLILAAIAMEATWAHFQPGASEIALCWYHPISILLAGFCGALPSLLWVNFEIRKGARFIRRLLLHAALVYIVIIAIGKFFLWYDDLASFLFVTISFLVIYACVWLATVWMTKQDDKRINAMLRKIQDSE